MITLPSVAELTQELIRFDTTNPPGAERDFENIAGMELFFKFAAELKVLPRAPELRFARELEIRNSASTNRL